jgi:predicted transposase YbfD/YdcC
MRSFSSVFAPFLVIEDPRARNRVHPLESVLFVVVVGVLCGGDGFVQIEEFAKVRRRFIEKYVPLPAGIPTHDTLARVFQALDPQQFRRAFGGFIAGLTGSPVDDVIAIDGKTLRGALDRKAEQNAKAEDQVHMVSAYSKYRGVVLEQLRSAAVANENQAARDLLAVVDVKGAVVTMDAAHCQVSTINLAVSRGADVVVGLKKNQKHLFLACEALCEQTTPGAVVETDEKSRGRHEVRRYEMFSAAAVTAEGPFAAVRTFARVKRTTTLSSGKTTVTSSFYASTLPPGDRLASCIRDRWAIENSLHYCLDVAFDEDGCRVRVANAAENLSRVRHLVLSLMKLAGGTSVGLGARRYMAMGDDDYLARILKL